MITDEMIWEKVIIYLDKYKIYFESVYYKYGANVQDIDKEEIYNEAALLLFKRSKKLNVCPFMVKRSRLYGYLRFILSIHRTPNVIDNYSENLFIDIEEDVKYDVDDITLRLGSVNKSEMIIIIDYLGWHGKKHSLRELCKKYKKCTSTINKIFKKHLKPICEKNDIDYKLITKSKIMKPI